MSGHIVIQQINGSSEDVFQSIQRFRKRVCSIIGQTRKAKYVTEWQVAYHEILSINNDFRTLNFCNLGPGQSHLHHELVGNYSKIYSTLSPHVHEVLENRGNPYGLETTYNRQIYNIATGAEVPRSTEKELICFNSEQIALSKTVQASHQP